MLLVVWTGTLILRADALAGEVGVQALEATYHVLWTMTALAGSPAEAHYWLPTVVLDPAPGDPLQWGATQPTSGGGLIYTSFPPLGFLLPLGLLRAVGAEPSFGALAHLNAVFGLAAAIGMGLLGATALAASAPGVAAPTMWGRALAFLGFSTGYLLLAESLLSHGPTYWPHSVSQIVLVFAMLLLLRHLLGRGRRWERAALVLLCGLYPALEWTGYVFNAGAVVGVLAAAGWDRDPDAARPWGPPGVVMRDLVSGPALGIVAATALVGLGTLAHFALAIGLEDMLRTSVHRAIARSPVEMNATLGRLLLGYVMSFGALLPLGLLALAGLAVRRVPRPLWIALGVAWFPMVENLLLLNHAIDFPFDRLKLAVPLVIALAAGLGQLSAWRWPAAALCLVLVVATNLPLHAQRLEERADWPGMDRANRVLAEDLMASDRSGCAVWGNERQTRGYLNLLFGRDIHEFATVASLGEEAARRGACAFVLLQIEHRYTDLAVVRAATIHAPDGTLLERIEAPAP